MKIYCTYRYEMAQHETSTAWKGHESSAAFRAAAAARAERLSRPVESTSQERAS